MKKKYTDTTTVFANILKNLDWRDEDGLPFRHEALEEIMEDWEYWFAIYIDGTAYSRNPGIFMAIDPEALAVLLEKYFTKNWEDFLQDESREQALALEIAKIAESTQVFRVRTTNIGF
jgi:hypothetical protein